VVTILTSIIYAIMYNKPGKYNLIPNGLAWKVPRKKFYEMKWSLHVKKTKVVMMSKDLELWGSDEAASKIYMGKSSNPEMLVKAEAKQPSRVQHKVRKKGPQ
jgi:hypothetical protein